MKREQFAAVGWGLVVLTIAGPPAVVRQAFMSVEVIVEGLWHGLRRSV